MHNPLFIRMLRLKMENKAHPTLTCDQAFFLFGEERNWAKKKGRRLPDHRFILRTRLRLKFWGEHCFFYQCQHEKIISTRNAVNVWLNISIHCSPSTSKVNPPQRRFKGFVTHSFPTMGRKAWWSKRMSVWETTSLLPSPTHEVKAN